MGDRGGGQGLGVEVGSGDGGRGAEKGWGVGSESRGGQYM